MQRSGAFDELGDVSGIIDGDQPVPRAAVVKPLSPHEREAQRAEHGDIAGVVPIERGGDARDLPLERVELAGAVATVDQQLLAPVEDPDGRDLDASAAALGVDHGDPARADRDVVDVRPAAAGHTTVMQHAGVAAVQA